MLQKAITLPNGDHITYHLQHRVRKTIGLKITNNGLVVHAPKRIFNYQLEKALMEKANWIINKLAAQKNNYPAPYQWKDKEELQLLGNPINLNFLFNSKNKQVAFKDNTLIIAMPNLEDYVLIHHKVIQWYKKHALQDFRRRIEILSTKLGVATPPLRLSNAKMRWGSCTNRGDIRINWRLIQTSPNIINYVICHELAHLKEMNHSAKFWAVVATISPDYKQAEKELKFISPQLHRM